MNANEKYKNIFGGIKSLSDEIPWTTGVSSMVEHLVWDTKSVLGISKAEFWKLIVSFAESSEYQKLDTTDKVKYIENELNMLQTRTEAMGRYEKPKSGYCSAREALRRNKFYSEDYLNKEFDIFLNLCSDNYLDYLYSRFIPLRTKGSWSTHGNGGLFWASTGIWKMQMDNLAYNSIAGVLVANELKLGGKKNKDQILKYCYLHSELKNRGFIDKNCQLLLLFISNKNEQAVLAGDVENEIAYCQESKKDLKYLVTDENIKNAR